MKEHKSKHKRGSNPNAFASVVRGKLIIQIPESELRHRYLVLQQPSSEIAKVFKCSGATVVARLNRYGIPSRGIKEASNTAPRLARMREITRGNTYTLGHYKVMINESELRHRYIDLQQSTPDIAKVFGCSKPTILKRLKDCQVPIRNTEDAHNIIPYLQKFRKDIPQSELYDLYVTKGLSTNDIAQKYKCSCNCVRNNLTRCGILIRSRAEASIIPVLLSKRRDYNPTPETREKLRQANVVRYSSQRERDRTGLATKNAYIKDPTLRVRQANNAKARIENDPTVLESLQEGNEKYWEDEENRKERSEWSKKLWQDPILRKQMIATRKEFWQDKDNPEVIQRRQAMMRGMNLRPNKPESIILNILDDLYPNEWKYIGDGQIIIGGLNPDFINVNGQKLIIECFGDYWHTQKLKPYRVNEGRVKVYAKYGYNTLIIWERETKDIDALKHKISSFVRE